MYHKKPSGPGTGTFQPQVSGAGDWLAQTRVDSKDTLVDSVWDTVLWPMARIQWYGKLIGYSTLAIALARILYFGKWLVYCTLASG